VVVAEWVQSAQQLVKQHSATPNVSFVNVPDLILLLIVLLGRCEFINFPGRQRHTLGPIYVPTVTLCLIRATLRVNIVISPYRVLALVFLAHNARGSFVADLAEVYRVLKVRYLQLVAYPIFDQY